MTCQGKILYDQIIWSDKFTRQETPYTYTWSGPKCKNIETFKEKYDRKKNCLVSICRYLHHMYIPNSFIIQQAHVTILFNAYISMHGDLKLEKYCKK